MSGPANTVTPNETNGPTRRKFLIKHFPAIIKDNYYLYSMPTVLFILGWRLYFYANENKEPVHIHGEKGDMECKYWILVDEMDIKEEFIYNMSPKDIREVRKIIFQNFDLLLDSWNNFFKKTT